MIFAVVGTQEPFDRLIKSLDEWCSISGYKDMIAQTAYSEYKPANFKTFDFIPVSEFDAIFEKADLIVSHAGMGTIITALRYCKPIIVMPRLAKFREHRNDHQLSTAVSFARLGYVKSVYSKAELFDALDNRKEIVVAPPISQYASDSLVSTIEEFLFKK
ncbi:MAG: glycosyltransferase [Omnitrophica WOR_2 bacterium]|jgi:UDP-N-acetylglucosamine transferase subunit ALG13